MQINRKTSFVVYMPLASVLMRQGKQGLFAIYHKLSIYRGIVQHDTTHSTTSSNVKLRPDVELTKDTHISLYYDVIMSAMASQITSLRVVYSTVYSDADQRKHQSSASLAFVWGIHRDRWIPRTKGQLRGKCFHLMTSSWDIHIST